jgi:hypothetical protein
MPTMVIASMIAVIRGERQPPTGEDQPQDIAENAEWPSPYRDVQ